MPALARTVSKTGVSGRALLKTHAGPIPGKIQVPISYQ
jgi:hypothetical protein